MCASNKSVLEINCRVALFLPNTTEAIQSKSSMGVGCVERSVELFEHTLPLAEMPAFFKWA